MSRGQNPLVLMMALSLPGAAHALGLGEIHVGSALNEPLAAEIDIVGATAEELSGLSATIATRDTFLRFGAERPAFLASAIFKVSQDVQGRPVLSIRATDSFTEPVVTLLVDLRWHNGEVIRQYSLLLDPAGFPAVTPSAAPVAIAIASVDSTASPSASQSARKMTQIKVGAKATLRGVAWRVGARSDTDLKKTMLAIFRVNPAAFDGNINRLHLGSVLVIPAAEQVAAISREEADNEINAQMAVWRAAPARSRASGSTPLTGEPVMLIQAAAPARVAAAVAPSASDALETAALNIRVQSLEQDLHDLQAKLERERDRLLDVQAKIRPAETTATDVAWRVPSVLAGIALLAGALGAIYSRRRRRITQKQAAKIDLAATDVFLEANSGHAAAAIEKPDRGESGPHAQRPVLTEDELELSAALSSAQNADEANESAQSTAPVNDAVARHSTIAINEQELLAAYEDTLDLSGETAILTTEIAAASGDTANLPAATVSLNAEALREEEEGNAADTVLLNPEILQVDTTQLDYNLVDLDITAQHVHMPSKLHEHVVVKERRTNLVDVLKMAIEREPQRIDLSMKLLETYYAAAATNRQGFLDAVQKLSRNRDRLGEGQWEKISLMGKQIATDTALFSSDFAAEDDKLVDCA